MGAHCVKKVGRYYLELKTLFGSIKYSKTWMQYLGKGGHMTAILTT